MDRKNLNLFRVRKSQAARNNSLYWADSSHLFSVAQPTLAGVVTGSINESLGPIEHRTVVRETRHTTSLRALRKADGPC